MVADKSDTQSFEQQKQHTVTSVVNHSDSKPRNLNQGLRCTKKMPKI